MKRKKAPGISSKDKDGILQALPVGVVCLNPRGTIIYLNERAAYLFGCGVSDLAGEDFFSGKFGWADRDGNLYSVSTHPLYSSLGSRKKVQRIPCTLRRSGEEGVPVMLSLQCTEAEQDVLTVFMEDDCPALSERVEYTILQKEIAVKNAVLDCSIAPDIVCDLDGTIAYVNEAYLSAWGYDNPSDLIGKKPQAMWDEWHLLSAQLPALLDKGELSGNVVGIRKDRTKFLVRFHARIFRNSSGEPEKIVASLEDVTENIKLRSERELAIELQHLLSGSFDLRETMQLVARKLQQSSGCEAIGLRLREGCDFPYFETRGFPAEFVAVERTLCPEDGSGISEQECISGNPPLLECICGRVLSGDTDSSRPFFTEEGSFWYNDADTLLRDFGEELRGSRMRNRCLKEGYLSLALIPLKANGEIYGLIQLNDKRRNYFTPEMIGTYEYLASIIALGLIQKRYQKKLLESEEKYRDYIQHSPNAVIILNDEGFILDVNPAACSLTGYDYEYIKGRLFTDFSIPEDREMLLGRLPYLLENKIGRQRLVRTIKKDGARAFWNVDTAVLPNGNIIAFAQDITESFKTEQRYRELFDNIPSGVAVFNPVDSGSNFRFIDVNHSVEIIEDISADKLIGKKITAVFPGVKEFGLFDVMKRVSRTGNTEVMPMSFYTDKRISGWRDNIVYRLPSGEIVIIYQDVTDKKIVEYALKESETKLRATFNAARNVAFITIDSTGTDCILDFSPGAEEVFGYTREDILGSVFLKLVPPDSRDFFRKHFEKVLRTHEVCSQEAVLLNSKGEEFPSLCSLHPILDIAGQITSLLLVTVDISERKKAEDALRNSEEHLRLMFCAAEDVAFIQVDIESRCITEFSTGAEKIFGYTKSEVLNENVLILHPNEKYILDIQEVIRRGEVWSDENARMLRKGGEEFPAKFRVYPLFDMMHKPYAALGVSVDISERYRAESRMRQSLQEKESLLKEIHHRVKNNLNIVISLLNLQAMRFGKNSPLQASLTEAMNRIRSMAMVHERLYNSHNLSSINFKEHVSILVNELKDVLTVSGGIRVDLDIADVGINIEKAIPCSLIITELMTNCIKHAFPDRSSGRILIQATHESGGEMLFIVEDNGCGLPEGIDPAKNGNLGFELIRVLVAQLHGTLTAESDSGTRIIITFQLD